ncbi:GTP-binding protein HflX [Candidatus Halobonum tyrrellensis G22]|uniref:GTPase HflX n=1 Tax=Candidatus Halobonum tyrrellensis G22 TaxID=1324957 RepID=V4HGB5_9EURY|nr:GTP-binding protein HflX [Candidatus Halobonum tyrrellensis G22]
MVAARSADERPDTTEIRGLAETAGYAVVGEVTQRRAEDSTYDLGRGKAETLAERVAEADAGAVVFDGALDPGQYADLRSLLPDGTELVDRYRLVLDVFAAGAGDEAATTQVELARLRYDLPRLRRATEESLLNEATEKGSPVLDAERRIGRLESRLSDLTDAAAERRETRRAEGFDLVAIAGYTNAGKSTLLRRLADDLSVEADGSGETDTDGAGSGDVDDEASVRDRLFETLETTTRRATVGGRRVLCTDTVGLVDDLPHELVRSFSSTLSEIRSSDAVLAVVDAAADSERFRRRVAVTADVLTADAEGAVVPVLNKVDRVDEATLDRRRAHLREAVPGAVEPVAVSARDGDGVGELAAALVDALPGARAEFVLANSGETQALLSWLHERGSVTTDYAGDRVEVTFAGKPSVVREAERRAADLEP